MTNPLVWKTKVDMPVMLVLENIRNRGKDPLTPELPKSRWFETEEEALHYAAITNLKYGMISTVIHQDNDPDSIFTRVKNRKGDL